MRITGAAILAIGLMTGLNACSFLLPRGEFSEATQLTIIADQDWTVGIIPVSEVQPVISPDAASEASAAEAADECASDPAGWLLIPLCAVLGGVVGLTGQALENELSGPPGENSIVDATLAQDAFRLIGNPDWPAYFDAALEAKARERGKSLVSEGGSRLEVDTDLRLVDYGGGRAFLQSRHRLRVDGDQLFNRPIILNSAACPNDSWLETDGKLMERRAQALLDQAATRIWLRLDWPFLPWDEDSRLVPSAGSDQACPPSDESSQAGAS